MKTGPTWKPKWREAKYKLMKSIHPSQGDLVDCIRVRIESEDQYLKEVATGRRDDDGVEHRMLKMSEQELETHKLVSKDGILLHYDPQNPTNPTKIASTVGLESKGEANLQAFVMGKDGSLYTGNHAGALNPDLTGISLTHASFLGGRPAELAGMISINDQGKIDKITDNSGHYRPEMLDMYRGIIELQKKMPGVFAADCKVNIDNSEQNLNIFINQMETINPVTNKMLHEELREARVNNIRDKRESLRSFEYKIDSIIVSGGEAIDSESLIKLFTACVDHEQPKASSKNSMNHLIDKLKETGRLKDFLESDVYGATPLEYIISTEKSDLVKLLLDNGANPNTKNFDEETPLHQATKYGNLKIAKLLIEKGADLEAKDAEGKPPLHNAYNNKEILDLLLEKGANLHEVDNEGRNIMHHAAFYGHSDMIIHLHKKGMDVNEVDNEGKTALKSAMDKYKRHLQSALVTTISTLVDLGADIKGLENEKVIKEKAMHDKFKTILKELVPFVASKNKNSHVLEQDKKELSPAVKLEKNTAYRG